MKIIRIITLLVLALCLLTGMSLPALADHEGEKGIRFLGKMGVVRGEVQEITGNTIKIDEKLVQVNDKTKIHLPTLGRQATLADIAIGAKVVAMVYDQESVLIARNIVVIPGKPVLKHHVGKVIEFSYDPAAGGNITIEDKNNNTYSFIILAGKFRVLPREATVQVGDTVTVISHRDPAQNQLIASGVVIHRPKPGTIKKIEGIITLDTTARTITIGTTVLTYNNSTLFMVRGTPGVASGQQATVTYHEVDGILIATKVMVGIDLARIQAQISEAEGTDL